MRRKSSLAIGCPACGAGKGDRCRTRANSLLVGYVHIARENAASAAARKRNTRRLIVSVEMPYRIADVVLERIAAEVSSTVRVQLGIAHGEDGRSYPRVATLIDRGGPRVR